MLKKGEFKVGDKCVYIEIDSVCPTDNPYTLIPFDFAIQGEIIGNGIQSNKYKLNDLELYLYNFYNIDTGKDIGFYFSDYKEKEEFHGITLGTISTLLHVPVVPILGACVITNDIDTLVDMSKGDSVLRKGYPREGIVFRAQKNKELSKYGNRISFKAINSDFLCPSV